MTVVRRSRILRARRVVARELDLAGRPLELQLGRPLDGGAGEERAVGDEAQALSAGGGRARLLADRRPLGARRQRGALADLAEGDAAEAARPRPRRRRPRRAGESVDAEALGELRDPGELVGHGREHGAALALQAALEVDRRPVALEVARARAGRGRRGRGSCSSNMPIADHALARSAASARTAGSAAASSPEMTSSARLVVDRLAVAGGAPGVGDAAAVRRARQVVDVASRRARERRGCVASTTSRRRRRPARAAPYGDRARPLRRAAFSQRSTTGARSTTGSSQSDDDRLRVARSPRAARGRRRARRARSSGSTAACAPSPARSSLRERVGLLDRLAARERRHGRRAGPRAAAARPRRARRPTRAPRSGAGRPCASGVAIRSRASRCANAKRPLSQSQPSSISGWLRERMRLTLPSRVVARRCCSRRGRGRRRSARSGSPTAAPRSGTASR